MRYSVSLMLSHSSSDIKTAFPFLVVIVTNSCSNTLSNRLYGSLRALVAFTTVMI